MRQPQHRVPVGVRPAPESTNNGLDISSLEIVVAVRPDEERFLRCAHATASHEAGVTVGAVAAAIIDSHDILG